MIQISHRRAQQLIRAAADGPLPEGQWATLQAHLETCAECRAYRDRLAALERRLNHGLGRRWSRVNGPPAGNRLARAVLETRERRGLRRRQALRAARFLLVGAVLAVALVLGLRPRAQPVALAPTAAPVPTPTPVPTPALNFQGVVALTLDSGGKSRIFLFNAAAGRSGAPDLAPLTTGDGQETSPAWSPDGQWLAFLSDTGSRSQLEVVSVAGTHRVRLTGGEDVLWRGPISWSYDGRWIALAGTRQPGGQSWIYAVPVDGRGEDGSGPRAITGTAGATGWSRFSPAQPLLAVQRNVGEIDIYHIEEGWSGEVTRTDRETLNLRAGMEGAFTWALDGMRLAYLAEGPYVRIGGNGVSGQFRPLASAVTSIVASGVIGPYVHPTALDASREVLATQPGAGELRALSYQPGGPLIATLRDAHQTGCWSPYLVNLPHYESVAPLLVPGLCVLNDLDSAAWTPDGRWLVVVAQVENAAHKPSGAPGLYALDIETRRFERLSDAPVDRTSAVAVRGAGDWLDIRPDAGPLPPETAAQSSVPRAPAGLDGTLVFSTTTSRGSEIYRMSLDGQAKWIPSPVAANQTCLALSPDGKQVAFLSNLDDASAQANGGSPGGDAGRGENEIFLADVDGGEWGQLTSPIAPYNTLALPAYDCPVWSPDGTLVAAALRKDLLPRLEVLRTDGQLLRSIPIDAPSTGVLPVWSPDGNTLFLAGPATGSRARASEYARVTTIKWRPPAGAATLLTLPGWDDVQAMAVSPDGKRLALVVVRQEPGSSALPSRAALEIYQLPGLGRVAEVNLSRYGYDPQAARSPGRMVWTGPDEVTLSVPRGLMASDKALLFTFDGQQMRLIARVPDALNGWALYPGWLVAGTDGGLYGIPLGPEGLNGPPLLLDPSPVDALDGH